MTAKRAKLFPTAPALDLSDNAKEQAEQVEDQATSYTMRLDSEALLLCALMWVEGEVVGDIATILDYLHPEDFYRPAHGQLFALMRSQASEGKPLSPAAINGRIEAEGERHQWPDGNHYTLLVGLSGLGSRPVQAIHYADQVLAESYRRNYAQMVTYLNQVAEEAPEGDLFPLLVEQGSKQRAAWNRREGFMKKIKENNTKE